MCCSGFRGEIDWFDRCGILREEVWDAVVMREGRVPEEVVLLEEGDCTFGELVKGCSIAPGFLACQALDEGDTFLQDVSFLFGGHLTGAFVGVAMEGDFSS